MNGNVNDDVYTSHKRRKTTHVTDEKMINNPIKNFDLLGKNENLEHERIYRNNTIHITYCLVNI